MSIKIIDYFDEKSNSIIMKIRDGLVCHIRRLDVSIGIITFHEEHTDEQLLVIPENISIMCGDGEMLRFKDLNKNYVPISWFSDYFIMSNNKKIVKIIHKRQHEVAMFFE